MSVQTIPEFWAFFDVTKYANHYKASMFYLIYYRQQELCLNNIFYIQPHFYIRNLIKG